MLLGNYFKTVTGQAAIIVEPFAETSEKLDQRTASLAQLSGSRTAKERTSRMNIQSEHLETIRFHAHIRAVITCQSAITNVIRPNDESNFSL